MYICGDGHDEIVYDQKDCPACDLLRTISDMEDKIFELKEQIDEFKEVKEKWAKQPKY